jgi:hypothetical protein
MWRQWQRVSVDGCAESAQCDAENYKGEHEKGADVLTRAGGTDPVATHAIKVRVCAWSDDISNGSGNVVGVCRTGRYPCRRRLALVDKRPSVVAERK